MSVKTRRHRLVVQLSYGPKLPHEVLARFNGNRAALTNDLKWLEQHRLVRRVNRGWVAR